MSWSDKVSFFREHYEYARAAGLTGPQARLAVTQAALETGWGTKGTAVKGHNYFGMKVGDDWSGKSINLPTEEESSTGKRSTIQADFRQYDDPVQAYRDWGAKMAKNWPDVMKATTFNEAVKALDHGVKGKYATARSYGVNLGKINNELTKSAVPSQTESVTRESLSPVSQPTAPSTKQSAWRDRAMTTLDSLHPAFRDRAKAFFDAAEKAGLHISPVPDAGGYRTREKQADIKSTGVIAASPGNSFHEYGLGFDYVVLDKETGKPKLDKFGKWDVTSPEWAQAKALAESQGLFQPIKGDLGHVTPINAGRVPGYIKSAAQTIDPTTGLSYPDLPQEVATQVAGPFQKDLVPPGEEVARESLAALPSGAEAVQPSASQPQSLAASLASLLSPVTPAYAEPAPAEKAPALGAIDRVIGTEALQSSFPARPEQVNANEAIRAAAEAPAGRPALAQPTAETGYHVPGMLESAGALPDPRAGPAIGIDGKSTRKSVTDDDIARLEHEVGIPTTERAQKVSSAEPGISANTAPDRMNPREFSAFAGLQPEHVSPLTSEALSPATPDKVFHNPIHELAQPVAPERLAPLSANEVLKALTAETAPPVAPAAAVPAPVPAPPLPAPVNVPQPRVAAVPDAPAGAAVAAAPALSAADIYGGEIGQARDNTGKNIVSRSDPHHTAVTNRYGVTTLSVDGNQVGSSLNGPLTKDSLSKDPLAGILDGAQGPKGKGMLGAVLGALLGGAVLGPAGVVAGGKVGNKLGKTGTLIDPNSMLGRVLGLGANTFPEAPQARPGEISGSNRDHDSMMGISPSATAAIEKGIAGPW